MRLSDLPTIRQWFQLMPQIYTRIVTGSLHRSLNMGNGYLPTKLSLSAGADPHITDETGRNALHMAAQASNTEALRALLEKKHVRVNETSESPFSMTSLEYACFSTSKVSEDKTKTVEMLLNARANPNYYTSEIRSSALYCAARNGNHAQVKLLLEAGAKIDECNLPATEDPLIESLVNLHITKRKGKGKEKSAQPETQPKGFLVAYGSALSAPIPANSSHDEFEGSEYAMSSGKRSSNR